MTTYRGAERLGQIAVPVRMLLGTETTTSLRAATAAFAALIPNAEVVVLEDQAHRAIDLDPDQFVRAVARRSIDSSGADSAALGEFGEPVDRRLQFVGRGGTRAWQPVLVGQLGPVVGVGDERA